MALASLTISPAQVSLLVGSQQQFTVSGKDAAGKAVTNPTVTWSLANGALGSITSGGLLTAGAAGSTQVTATAGSVSVSSPVTIVSSASANLALNFGQTLPGSVIKSVTVTPAAPTDDPPGTPVLTAHAFDQTGAEVTGKFTWLVSDTNVGTLFYSGTDSTATFTPLGPAGTATVKAIAGNGASGSVTMTVRNVAPTVSNPTGPSTISISGDVSGTFVVTFNDANKDLPLTSTNPSWTSNHAGTLSVQNQGSGGVVNGTVATGTTTLVYTPLLPGPATLTATVSDGTLSATQSFNITVTP